VATNLIQTMHPAGVPKLAVASSGGFRHRIDPDSERAVKGEKAARVDIEVLLLDDRS
jgi:hypothetical protein